MTEREYTATVGVSAAAAAAPDTEYGQVKGRTQREIFWRRFRRHRLAMVGGLILVLLYILALAGPFVTPYGYDEIDFTSINQGPSLKHPMGTDEIGRDELTRVVYGGRISLLVGLGVGLLSTLVGATVGIVSGFYGRWVDTSAMSFTDFMLVVPPLPLLIVLGSIFDFSAVTIMLVLVILSWMQICRLVRGQVLSLRSLEFVQAAQAIGVSNTRIMLRHILPNVLGIMVVQATLVVAIAIIAESSLSYLGLGIQPPTPSWGNLLEDARTTMTTQWWLAVFPGAMIVVTVLCVNFLGDGLRDALDPKVVE